MFYINTNFHELNTNCPRIMIIIIISVSFVVKKIRVITASTRGSSTSLVQFVVVKKSWSLKNPFNPLNPWLLKNRGWENRVITSRENPSAVSKADFGAKFSILARVLYPSDHQRVRIFRSWCVKGRRRNEGPIASQRGPRCMSMRGVLSINEVPAAGGRALSAT
jgi:hypothetical protein